MSKAIILMYHDVRDDPGREKYCVSRKSFVDQLTVLSESGVAVQTVQEYLSKPKDNAIIISFDDGNASNLSVAAPELEKRGFHGTFFITTDWVGRRSEFMSWPEIRSLHAECMEIGAHGRTHQFLTDVDHKKLLDELGRPKEELEAQIGESVESVSAPGGRFNKAVLRASAELGYRSMSVSRPGINHITDSDFSVFRRYAITQKTTLSDFMKIIQFDLKYATLQQARYFGKGIAKQILGNKWYQGVWNHRMRG